MGCSKLSDFKAPEKENKLQTIIHVRQKLYTSELHKCNVYGIARFGKLYDKIFNLLLIIR